MTSSNPYQSATHFLSQLDADWAQLITTVGPCYLQVTTEREPYEALIRAVSYQQLHARAGDAIIKRLLDLHADAFPLPAQLLAAEFDALRACGFSAHKIETIQGIAAGAINGLVPARHEAVELTNDELIARLTTLKGIGQWTVEMLLIFNLERMDILPADDFGVVQGYKRLKNLAVAPKPKEIALIGQAWRPYRTIASWYLWQMPK